jgi:hypothetical protein
MCREFIARSTKMRRSIGPLSASALLHRDPYSVVFIINIAEFDFRYTQVLSTKVQYYLERAEHCERMAALTSNREVRANFAELAQQWRDLARQHQNLGNPPPQSN